MYLPYPKHLSRPAQPFLLIYSPSEFTRWECVEALLHSKINSRHLTNQQGSLLINLNATTYWICICHSVVLGRLTNCVRRALSNESVIQGGKLNIYQDWGEKNLKKHVKTDRYLNGMRNFRYNSTDNTAHVRYKHEGESNENLKSAIKIRNTARLSCKLTTVILMVWVVADRC